MARKGGPGLMADEKRGSTISAAHQIDPLKSGKLPEASKNFNQQFAKAAAPSHQKPPAGGGQGIATSAELKQRLAAQKPKTPVLQPKPPASVAASVHKQEQQKNQTRITHLKTSLGGAQNKFERNFEKSREPKR